MGVSDIYGIINQFIMPITLVEQNWFRWAILLILGFPLMMILLNEVIVRLRQEEKPLVATIIIFRNLVFPLVALLLFLTRVQNFLFDNRQPHLYKLSYFLVNK